MKDSSYPLTPEKLKFPPVTSARDYIKDHAPFLFQKKIETGILCFSPGTANQTAKQFSARGKHALGARLHFFEKQSAVLISHFGVGAPSAVIQLEHLRAFSVKRVFSIGLAGSLSNKLSMGQGVFIHTAFRDEGCSYHYQKASPFVTNPHQEEGKKPAEQLKLTPVKSWTTDAPYRETGMEIEKWKKRGLSCVEMEASALMTVANCHSLPLFCLAVISDFLEKGVWRRGFSHPLVQSRLLALLKTVLLY